MFDLIRHTLRVLATAGLLLSTGCGSATKRAAVPVDLVGQAELAELPGVRTWGDVVSDDYVVDLAESIRQEIAYHAAHPDLKRSQTVDLLTLSGGGEDGAFGAGLLCGWTKSGTRPEFKVVTGISTGALMAPFAFLGPAYDHKLRVYTKIEEKNIYSTRSWLSIPSSDSLYSTIPLHELVAETFDQDVMEAVGREHRRGRRLLIGTTNLDAQRPVIWNLSAIAASNHPDALKRCREIMIASASIPVAFPPVLIPVDAGGKRYDEMHVDGGCVTQVFLLGAGVTRDRLKQKLGQDYAGRKTRLYIIRNGRTSPHWKGITPKLIPIGGRAVATMIQTSGLNDLLRLSVICQQNEVDFNLANIPDDVTAPVDKAFDSKYMNDLFTVAFEEARKGFPWRKSPPISLGSPVQAEPK